MRSSLRLWTLILAFLSPQVVGAEESYSFDPSETEKKLYHLGGYIELRPTLSWLDRDASLHRLQFYGREEGPTTADYSGRLQVEGSLEKGIGRALARGNLDYRKSYLGESFGTSLDEGYLSLKPSPSATLDLGKKTLRWGKGYAWSPVAFLDRPKDPEDPELALEGFTVVSADYIRSFAGPLQAVSLTPVALPVYEGVNDDFGRRGHWNLGGKLYALLYDTDLDFVFLSGGSRTNRYGVDFSRNVTTNFEIHGELAYIRGFRKAIVDGEGRVSEREASVVSYLLGLRYLTEAETTWIAEYYYNGGGFRRDEVRDFFSFIDRGHELFVASGDEGLLKQAAALARGGLGRPNPMRDYLYVRASQKEPFDILYFTPSVAAIVNLGDRSFSLSPELLYTRVTNLELRLKVSFLAGPPETEYGEKQSDYRAEFRARYFF